MAITMALEITMRCPLKCVHCYADSGPWGAHADLSVARWTTVLRQATTAGVTGVQFIGGEPLTHPGLSSLVQMASDLGLAIELFSSLVPARDSTWALLRRHDVRVATSVYAASAAGHDAVTTVQGSFDRTMAGIRRALVEGLAVRVGVIRVNEHMNVDAVKAMLSGLGVTDIRFDETRGVGRGAAIAGDFAGCGACGVGQFAVAGDGTVWPCVMRGGGALGRITDPGFAFKKVVGGVMIASELRPDGVCVPGIEEHPGPPDIDVDVACVPNIAPAPEPPGDFANTTCVPNIVSEPEPPDSMGGAAYAPGAGPCVPHVASPRPDEPLKVGDARRAHRVAAAGGVDPVRPD